MNITDFTVNAVSGPLPLARFEDQPLLVVNTASECMFTPQYAELEVLHQTYGERGLVVLGFPCNQFGEQEPGSDDQVQQFCQVNYAVTFPVMAKVNVNGENAHPLFRWLSEQAPSPSGNAVVDWNFTKFLVSRDGETIQRFEPKDAPASFASQIEAELGAAESA